MKSPLPSSQSHTVRLRSRWALVETTWHPSKLNSYGESVWRQLQIAGSSNVIAGVSPDGQIRLSVLVRLSHRVNVKQDGPMLVTAVVCVWCLHIASRIRQVC